MSQTIEQKNSLDGFVKPGELVDIRSGHELSLQDRRIFNLLIENAWSEIGQDKPHRIAMNRLRGPRHRGSERVADSVKTLMTTLVEVPTTLDGQSAIFTTQLCGETTRMIDEDSPNAVLVYEFPKGLRKIIQDSRYWGRIKAYVMFAFNSKYALALYEAVCLRGNLRVNEQRFSVDEFRALLGVEPGKMPLFKNLKKWALDPAVVEVNGLSDFKVEIEPVRNGGQQRGRLIGFMLRWEKKTAEEWKDVCDELMRPKVGRIARISGKVEKVHMSTIPHVGL
ncbi:MAG: replication protein RepB [Hyphomicrobiales bacterium]|nr:MAG: replication protein RepB [Hyphomicrobiales bacterium]